jgi:phytanoyl-CoA hydroxylase
LFRALHFSTSPAAQFFAAADAGRSSGWRYLPGTVLVVLCWVFGGAYVYGLTLQLPLGAVTGFAAMNLSILMLMVGVLGVTLLLHRRPWRTLVTPQSRIDWRRMATGAVVWGLLLLLGAVAESLLFPGRYSWTPDWSRWPVFVVTALLLTPLQCMAEELAFRGYLMQGLSRLWSQPVFVAIASSLVFTLPHLYNPEVAAYGLGIMALNYFAMALFLATITLRDGRLELAIGAHTANNLLLALGVNYQDSVFDTPSLFTADTLDPVYSLLTLLLGAVIFYCWVFRKRSAMDKGFSAEEVALFERDGYLIARGLLPEAGCARMRSVAERDLAAVALPVEYEAETRYPGAPESLEAPGGRTVRRLLQAYARDAVFREWATAAPVAERLRQLLGPEVALAQAHHNCVMTKNPHYSSLTNWHRDIRYWAYQRPELISVWFALGEERTDNGCLLVIPGSHRMEFAPERLDDAQFLRTDVAENAELLDTQVPVELRPGDVLFFHCRLFHAAGNNRSVCTKFSAVFTYHALDNAPLPGTRSAGQPDVLL